MMKNEQNDISDNEIRIISSVGKGQTCKKRFVWLYVCGVLSLLAIGIWAVVVIGVREDVEDDPAAAAASVRQVMSAASANETFSARTPVVEKMDTLIDGVKLSVLTPHNAIPTLEIGHDVVNDSAVVLMLQAADVRKDNGKIVGSFVVKGKLVCKGEAKAGFCSIIGDEISVGVADATPLFERALMSDGYFFRQYPLVVAGQIVKNKPKGKSIRKALVETEGVISVVVSHDRLSFYDFSQTLVSLGVKNAIYLVGGNSFGYYKESTGKKIALGTGCDNEKGDVNYIVWR